MNKKITWSIFSLVVLAFTFLPIFPYTAMVNPEKTFFNQWLFTSIFYQFQVSNYLAVLFMLGIFAIFGIAIYGIMEVIKK